MPAERSDTVAVRLTSRIDDLSQALSRAGIPLAERARLLEQAALAAMHAVTLEASRSPEPGSGLAPVTPLSGARGLRSASA